MTRTEQRITSLKMRAMEAQAQWNPAVKINDYTDSDGQRQVAITTTVAQYHIHLSGGRYIATYRYKGGEGQLLRNLAEAERRIEREL